MQNKWYCDFSGRIDKVMVCNRAVSASETAQICHSR